MDPLSIAASVTGLLAVSGKLLTILTEISLKRLSVASPPITAILGEVLNTASSLRKLKAFLDGEFQVPLDRRRHVLLEHLAGSLTGCVIATDELESVLEDLGLAYNPAGSAGMIRGSFDQTRWLGREPETELPMRRLRKHRASLNMILSVFQCTSAAQMGDLTKNLCDNMREVSLDDSVLLSRLRRLQGYIVAGSRDENHSDSDVEKQRDEDRQDLSHGILTSECQPEPRSAGELSETQALGQEARVDTAMASTKPRSMTTMFSAISLADIPDISLHPLPILIHEITNSEWYVHAARLRDGRLGDLSKKRSSRQMGKTAEARMERRAERGRENRGSMRRPTLAAKMRREIVVMGRFMVVLTGLLWSGSRRERRPAVCRWRYLHVNLTPARHLSIGTS